MITLTFRGTSTATQPPEKKSQQAYPDSITPSKTTTKPKTGLWQPEFSDSDDDIEKTRLHHWISKKSSERPGVVVLDEEEISKRTSANACKAKELPTAHTPVNKDTFQKEEP